MNLAWCLDSGNVDGTRGGAEITMDTFKAARPENVNLVGIATADVVVFGNCTQFTAKLIPELMGKRVVRYHHDLGHAGDPTLNRWLDDNAEHIFTSPLHRERYSVTWHPQGEVRVDVIPPAMNLEAFRPPRQVRRHGKREGTCTVGSWQNPGKGGEMIADWALRNKVEVDVFGPGPFVPVGPYITLRGEVTQDDLPEILWGYGRFIFLPTAPEPFGRCVVEAAEAGCEVITNDLVGAKHVLETDPKSIRTAAEDFWSLLCD